MFPLYPNYEDESKPFHFSSSTLDTALQGTQQFQTPCLVPNTMQPTTNRDNPYESQENWMRIKRQRDLDCSSLAIGNWSGSNQFQMHGVGNGGEGYGYYKNYPYGPYNTPTGFGVENAHEVSNGFSVGNGNKVSVQRTVGVDVLETAVSEKVRRRMMRNRESAARSRARKQAQNAQQQIEIMKLQKENELLRRIIKFLLAIIRTKREEMPTLSRSFSAPL